MKNELLALLEPTGQTDLLNFWDELNSQQQTRLAEQIRQIDFVQIEQLYRNEGQQQESTADLSARAEPPPAFRLAAAEQPFSPQQAQQRGEEALRNGKLGMILVAGGQGTRLGFDHPKGMFPLGPVSERSLFEILIDQLTATARRYQTRIPLFLMTSPLTHHETIAFFDKHNRFGLAEEDLHVFCQGVMPALDATSGKILLAEKDTPAVSPDGHGGMLAALASSGCLAEIKQRGIEHLFYGQVDNPLTQICDSQLVGYHLLAGSEMTTQVVEKADPQERVGNVVSVDGRVRIVEYIDLPGEIARQCDEDGQLRLWAGNLAVHLFKVSFLSAQVERVDALPFHRARKATPFIDARGARIEPQENNSIKFERFIFDLLPHAQHAVVVEADRREAFAPVKNASTAVSDTAETAQALMIARDQQMLRLAGAKVEAETAVEINPLFALDAQELKKKIEPELIVREPTYFH